MKILIFKLSLMLLLTVFSVTLVSGQQKTSEQEFDEYTRNIFQTVPAAQGTNRRNGGRKQTSTTTGRKKVRLGKPGMKIWVEGQQGGVGNFSRVAPTSVFYTKDRVRFRFKLNFDGYLSIFHRGTDGKSFVIFPKEGLSTKITANTEFLIPGEIGWEFDENVGDEELIFIVSRTSVTNTVIKTLSATRDFDAQQEVSVSATDRSLVNPATENNFVYVLASDARLRQPLVFRMILKHC